MAGLAGMDIVQSAIAEELGEIHAAAVDEVRSLLIAIAAYHMRKLRKGAFLERHRHPASGSASLMPSVG